MMRLISGSFPAIQQCFFPTDKDRIENRFYEQGLISFNDIYMPDEISLQAEIQTHLLEYLHQFCFNHLECRFLNKIFNDTYFQQDSLSKYPRYIFSLTDNSEYLNQFQIENYCIFHSNLEIFYKEVSALGNALGLNLNERDNYPGGKQKAAFHLVDLAWSAIKSNALLIIC